MDAWGRAEGGGGYSSSGEGKFNWLNTTRDAPGAVSFNSVGVKNFPNFEIGVRTTIGALTNGYYDNIVAGLRSGRANAAQLATMVAGSKWGTGSGVLRTLGAQPRGMASQPMGPGTTQLARVSATAPVPAAPNAAPAQFQVSPSVLGALFQGVQSTLSGHPDMSGLLALAASRQQFQASHMMAAPTVLSGRSTASTAPADLAKGFSGYVNPIPKGSVFERNDQGVDYRTPVGSMIPALGDAKVVRVSQDAGGFGKAIYYQLLNGPQRGKYVYVGHADPLAQAGTFLRAGQPVARSRQTPFGNAAGTPGHIEMGWAGSPYGPLGTLGSSNVGAEFFSFLRSLGG
jgi:murein DD-endopeptidase MepM/ murein hydrolase activator NlpD